MSSRARRPQPPEPERKPTIDERVEEWLRTRILKRLLRDRAPKQVARAVARARGRLVPHHAVKIPVNIEFEFDPDGAVYCYPFANGARHRVEDKPIVAIVQAAYTTSIEEISRGTLQP